MTVLTQETDLRLPLKLVAPRQTFAYHLSIAFKLSPLDTFFSLFYNLLSHLTSSMIVLQKGYNLGFKLNIILHKYISVK